MVKFTLILEDFQLSTFDINLPVILSIPLGVDDKKSGRNFHQTSVSVAPNAFPHLSNSPSPSKNGSPRTQVLHFLKKKGTTATDTSAYVCRPLQRKCQYYVGFRLLFESLLAAKNRAQIKNIKICHFLDFRTFDF